MKTNKKQTTPELLAPAGSLSTALTAFDYGADAVYAGLNKFNARERTENFSFEDMSKLLAYSKKVNRKVYITLNTLIKESEIPSVVEYIGEIAKLSPDAVIVQDLGVLRIIREYFPELEIHASTQMGFHNSAGLNFAAKLGIKRAILERQVTLEETEAIVKNSRIQTEVFIHGALCCSMSGNCLLSSWLGGWSGNRGKCKQPCRRRYHSENGNGFFLSTKDLCSLDIMQKYKQIGVTSLKIEGRLRKSDYVKSVVSAYRMILDAHPDDNIDKLIKQGREILGRSLGRKWSNGFRDRESFRDVIEYKRLGVSGQPCGNVVNIKKSGFKAIINKRIHIGDRLRVQPKSGDEGPTLTVTKLFQNNISVTKVTKGQECFIACDKEVPSDGMLYKIGESGGDLNSRIKNLPLSSTPINLHISVEKNAFTVKLPHTSDQKIWKEEINLSEAKNKALTGEDVVNMFKANNLEEYSLGRADVQIKGNFFIPASELKKIRRDFWKWFQNNVSDIDLNSGVFDAMEKFRVNYQKESKHKTSAEKSVQIGVSNKKIRIDKDAVLVHSLDDFDSSTQEVALPNYCFESRLPVIKRKIRKAVSKGKKRFRVTSLYQLELLSDFKDIEITTSYPLPVCNSIAAAELRSISRKMKTRLNHIQAWVELEKDELNNLIQKSSEPIEIFIYGRIHLLVTRAFIPAKGRITDSKGNSFFVVLDSDEGLVYLYSEKILSLPEIPGTASFRDFTFAEQNENELSSFNYEYSLL